MTSEQRLAASQRKSEWWAARKAAAVAEDPQTPAEGAKKTTVVLPELGAMMLLEARMFKRMLGGIQGGVWRSEVDEQGGMWTVGDIEDCTIDGVYHASGIRLIYEEGKFAAERAGHQLLDARSRFAAASRHISTLKAQKREIDEAVQKEYDDRKAFVDELERIAASKISHVWQFPDREPIEVSIAY